MIFREEGFHHNDFHHVQHKKLMVFFSIDTLNGIDFIPASQCTLGFPLSKKIFLKEVSIFFG